MVNKKAQGALEYLILIGAAVLIAVIVITFVVPSAGNLACENAKRSWEASCNGLTKTLCNNIKFTDFDGDGTADCTWDSANNICTLSSTANPPECK